MPIKNKKYENVKQKSLPIRFLQLSSNIMGFQILHASFVGRLDEGIGAFKSLLEMQKEEIIANSVDHHMQPNGRQKLALEIKCLKTVILGLNKM